MIIARKEIKTVQDLRGKSIGVGSVGGLPYRLLRTFVKKFDRLRATGSHRALPFTNERNASNLEF